MKSPAVAAKLAVEARRRGPSGVFWTFPSPSFSNTKARTITDKTMLLALLQTIELANGKYDIFFLVSRMKHKGQPGWYQAKCKITSVIKMVGSILYKLRVVYEDDEVRQVQVDKDTFVKLVLSW